MNNASASVNGAGRIELNDAAAITEQVLKDIQAMQSAKNIYTTDVQLQMLTSHVKAMVLRSITGEPLPDVEKDLFDEISAESMQMAEEVVSWFGNLPIEEAYLLSVHFEVARDNEPE
ncbi:PRD domain-containing protein [Rahnella sp. C60]|uniref:PRD domain-containing protein n=1 Tax=Rahnella perminowiae TaxID=2816244 RepID=UPI001C2548FA|nr:PRD domain-containing protein [Rahnella perminowiae]MBU9827241.1 PRD domain-containing protein [Rahnella perminowiae]MCR8999704.1 PRD domain-containing protein [Rahnella perminowiae]